MSDTAADAPVEHPPANHAEPSASTDQSTNHNSTTQHCRALPTVPSAGYGSLEMQIAIAEGRIVKLSHENSEMKLKLAQKTEEIEALTSAYELLTAENNELHAQVENSDLQFLHERSELFNTIQHQQQQLSLLQQQCAQFQHKLSTTLKTHSRSMSTEILAQSSSASEERITRPLSDLGSDYNDVALHKQISLLDSQLKSSRKELSTAQETIQELESQVFELKERRKKKSVCHEVGIMAEDVAEHHVPIRDRLVVSALHTISKSSAHPIQIKLHVNPEPAEYMQKQLLSSLAWETDTLLLNLPPIRPRSPGDEITFDRDRQPLSWSDDLPSPGQADSATHTIKSGLPPRHHPGSRSFSWGGETTSDPTELFGSREQPSLRPAPTSRTEMLAAFKKKLAS